jgi:D-alanyl-D-alanine carboxypeptidase (penicillin-binding protein 5/6)
MEASTGKVLYEKNADEALPPASVTKVMTLLLVMEALDAKKISLEDKVRASANACSMGGSQIFLKENEEMSVEDLIKSVVIASANDAAVVLAEYVAGTEASFVEMMNKRAQELGMKNTFFENTNGLDDTVERHLTSARDIAIMSRELIKYPKITEYSSIWMDSIRNGEFGLTNTNRLVRFYKGATGLKTGSTAKAGFCISATAERNGMGLICVIMGAESRDIRNAAATSLLDYGFANYAIFKDEGKRLDDIPIIKGNKQTVGAEYNTFSAVLKKGDISKITKEFSVQNKLDAPIRKGEIVGYVIYKIDGKEIGKNNIIATDSVEMLRYSDILLDFLKKCAIIL